MKITKTDIEETLTAKLALEIDDKYQVVLESILIEKTSVPAKLAKRLEKVYRKFENTTNNKWNLQTHGVDIKPFGEKTYSNGEIELIIGGVDKTKDKQDLSKLIALIEKTFKVKFKKQQSGTHGNPNPDGLYSLIFHGLNTEHLRESADVFLDEDTGEQYFTELCEDALEERKIIIKVNSKGQRIKKIKCPKGRVAKSVNGRIVCVTPTGRERLTKKLAIRRTVRTKKAKGAGFAKRVNFRRQRALKKRRAMGLGKQ